MGLSFQKGLVGSQVRRVGLLDRDRCPARYSIGDVGKGLAVASAEIKNLALRGHVLLDGLAQQWDKQIALISAHHQDAPQRIRLQHPGKTVVILPMRIKTFKLVADDLERIVQLRGEVTGSRAVNNYWHLRCTPSGRPDCAREPLTLTWAARHIVYATVNRST